MSRNICIEVSTLNKSFGEVKAVDGPEFATFGKIVSEKKLTPYYKGI